MDERTPEMKASQRAMDDAIRAHVQHYLGRSDLAVSHLVLVGVRSSTDDGFDTGGVHVLMSNGSMPTWEAKGLLAEAGDNVRELYEVDGADEGGEG